MPAPDLPLSDGSKTYSVEGIQNLIEWAVDAKLSPRVDEKLKPLLDRDEAARKAEAQTHLHQRLEARTQKVLEEAQTWPLFGKLESGKELTPFQAEVFAALKADPAIDLRGAYMKVALPRFTEDDTTKRERIIKELNEAKKSPAVRGGVDAQARPRGPKSSVDIARDVITKLEAGA